MNLNQRANKTMKQILMNKQTNESSAVQLADCYHLKYIRLFKRSVQY